MRRFLALLLMLIPMLTCAQGTQHNNFAWALGLSSTPVLLPGATVTVCAGTTLPAPGVTCSPTTTIYSSPLLGTNIAANPITADAAGNYNFWAPAGLSFVISVAKTSFTTYSYSWTAPQTGPAATVTGSPTAGQLAIFSGANSLTNSNLILPGIPDTLVGQAFGQALTNKTFDISANTLKNVGNTTGHVPRNNGVQYVDGQVQAGDLVPGLNGNCVITSGTTPMWGSCAGIAGVQLIGAPNLTAASANAATTATQIVAAACATAPCYGAGALNVVNKTIDWESTGTMNFSTGVTCFLMSIGIGNQNSFGSLQSTCTSSAGAAQYDARAVCTVKTTGSTGTMQCLVIVTILDTGVRTQTTSQVYTIPTLDLTVSTSPTLIIQFNTASTSNVVSQLMALTHMQN